MPFKSEAERRYLWSQHPDIAEAWSHGRSSVTGKKEFKPKNKGLPKHKRKKKRNVGEEHTGKYY
jgi:hypothetical protein